MGVLGLLDQRDHPVFPFVYRQFSPEAQAQSGGLVTAVEFDGSPRGGFFLFSPDESRERAVSVRLDFGERHCHGWPNPHLSHLSVFDPGSWVGGGRISVIVLGAAEDAAEDGLHFFRGGHRVLLGFEGLGGGDEGEAADGVGEVADGEGVGAWGEGVGAWGEDGLVKTEFEEGEGGGGELMLVVLGGGGGEFGGVLGEGGGEFAGFGGVVGVEEAAEGGDAGAQIKPFGLGTGGQLEGFGVGVFLQPSVEGQAFGFVEILQGTGRRLGGGIGSRGRSGWRVRKRKNIL